MWGTPGLWGGGGRGCRAPPGCGVEGSEGVGHPRAVGWRQQRVWGTPGLWDRGCGGIPRLWDGGCGAPLGCGSWGHPVFRPGVVGLSENQMLGQLSVRDVIRESLWDWRTLPESGGERKETGLIGQRQRRGLHNLASFHGEHCGVSGTLIPSPRSVSECGCDTGLALTAAEGTALP